MTEEPFTSRRLVSGNCYACAGDNWVINQATVGCATCSPPSARATPQQMATIRQFARDLGWPTVYVGGWIKLTLEGEAQWTFWTERMSRVGAAWLLEKLARSNR